MISRAHFPWLPAEAGDDAPAAELPAVATAKITAEVPKLAMTARELAAATSLSVSTIAGLVRAGKGPPSFVVPGGRLRRFPVDGARQWVADLAEQSEPSQEPNRPTEIKGINRKE